MIKTKEKEQEQDYSKLLRKIEEEIKGTYKIDEKDMLRIAKLSVKNEDFYKDVLDKIGESFDKMGKSWRSKITGIWRIAKLHWRLMVEMIKERSPSPPPIKIKYRLKRK